MSTDSEGYVHRPGARDDDSAGIASGDGEPAGEPSAPTNDSTASTTEPSAPTNEPPDATDDDGFGRRGWLLVAAVVVGFLVVPGVIYLRPATPADAGLPYVASMLVLPLLPAVLLGLAAVWSMSSSARSRR